MVAEGDGGEREKSKRTMKCLFLAALKWGSRADGYLVGFPACWDGDGGEENCDPTQSNWIRWCSS